MCAVTLRCVLCYVSAENPDVYIVERLFSSSLVVVVSHSIPRRMNVYHFKKGTEICNYSYSNSILAVRLNRQVAKILPHRCRSVRMLVFNHSLAMRVMQCVFSG